MKRLFFVLLAVILAFGCCGCAQTKKASKYQFYACDPELLPSGTYNLRGVYEDGLADKHSLFIGQVLALFGSDYTTNNYEDLFSKAVAAEDSEGNVIYFEVYYGSSGPAIGGAYNDDNKKEVLAAADELAKYIMAAKPADFEWQSSYNDLDVILKMGVKDGVPYYDTIFPEGFLEGEE